MKYNLTYLHRLLALGFLIILAHKASFAATKVLSGQTMGTYYTLKFDSNTETLAQVDKAVQNVLQQINKELNNWDTQSWVSRFNQIDSTDWQCAPTSVLHLIQQSKLIHEQSGGAFDITLAELIRVWGFGNKKIDKLPTNEAIHDALQLCGMKKLELNYSSKLVRKKVSELGLNFSAIAKGYTVDLLAETLTELKIEHYLIDIGGEIRCSINTNATLPWKIGIRKPSAIQKLLQTTVFLSNAALATSGDYLNYIKMKGISYPHLLEPSSGRPVLSNLKSVSIIAKNCLLADAWASTCLVIGRQKAMQLIEEMAGIEAYFIESLEDGELKTHQSSGWSRYQLIQNQ